VGHKKLPHLLEYVSTTVLQILVFCINDPQVLLLFPFPSRSTLNPDFTLILCIMEVRCTIVRVHMAPYVAQLHPL